MGGDAACCPAGSHDRLAGYQRPNVSWRPSFLTCDHLWPRRGAPRSSMASGVLHHAFAADRRSPVNATPAIELGVQLRDHSLSFAMHGRMAFSLAQW